MKLTAILLTYAGLALLLVIAPSPSADETVMTKSPAASASKTTDWKPIPHFRAGGTGVRPTLR